jgi:hypothetical protein
MNPHMAKRVETALPQIRQRAIASVYGLAPELR